MPLSPGTRLGPYEIASTIGAGGMGEVYCAKDLRLRREVAIKVLPAAFSNDSERLRRFEQEAQAAGSMNHPNILAVYDLARTTARFMWCQNCSKAKHYASGWWKGQFPRARLSIVPYRLPAVWQPPTERGSSTGT